MRSADVVTPDMKWVVLAFSEGDNALKRVDLSSIFNYDSGGTVHSRVEGRLRQACLASTEAEGGSKAVVAFHDGGRPVGGRARSSTTTQ
jgi:hypothetical protein